MQFLALSSSLCTLCALLSSLAHASPIPSAKDGWPMWEKAEAVYFMTNQAENAIVAIAVAEGGMLASTPSMTLTGGAGGNQVNGTGFPEGPDALSSQGSLQICGNLLFALNPGSSTISVLSIDPHEPTQLSLVGHPVWTGGDFPVTVAVSKELGIACVGNGGANSGVSCAEFDEAGLSPFDTIRPLPFGQTTPPVGPPDDISDVFFTEDNSALLVIAKGNGTAADKGYIATFPVDAASKQVSYQDTRASPEVGRVMFGSATIPDTTNILVSDATFGAMLLSLADLNTPYAITNITNQMATCWAITSPATGTGFVDDVIVSQLVEIDLGSGAIVSVTNPKNSGQGMIDMRAVGDKIYALSPGNGTLPAAVTVFDVSGGRGSAQAVQNYAVEGADRSAEGMAVYVGPGGW